MRRGTLWAWAEEALKQAVEMYEELDEAEEMLGEEITVCATSELLQALQAEGSVPRELRGKKIRLHPRAVHLGNHAPHAIGFSAGDMLVILPAPPLDMSCEQREVYNTLVADGTPGYQAAEAARVLVGSEK